MKKKEKKTQSRADNVYLVINLVLAIASLVLSLLLSGEILAGNQPQVSTFLGIVIIIQVVFQLLLFMVYKKAKDRIRILLVGLVYISAVVLAFMAKDNYILFYVANALVVIAMALDQFMLTEKEKTKSGMITNILLGLIFTALAVAILLNITEENKLYISYVTVILFLLSAFRKLLFPSLRFGKIRLFVDILIRTHALDVFVGLVAFIIAFSFMFPMVEPTITTFWDGMWYSFAVVTTIGFGDFAATSLVGRILTVVLGIYGIVVVAIMTSVIVNFYNAVSAKEKTSDIIK
ncbi:MAG: two pore domain potassium channel family protein [Acholeplasmatales bacterium]|nr:two pore domain potassium channel family protein [Acholeplasmatales bacterium]